MPRRPACCKPKPCADITCSEDTRCNECSDRSLSTLPFYEEQCPPKFCQKICEGMSGQEIWTKYNPAVVGITSEFHFTTSTNPALVPPSTTLPLQSVYLNGNGFFITKHIIVTAAHLVLAPPNSFQQVNRWPFTTNLISPSFQPAAMIRANRIMVDVVDVNGSNHSYTYQATLLGVSGFGDLALLYINREDQWNQNIPCIKECHPHFNFGCSRKYHNGEPVFAIGNPFSRAINSVNAPRSLNANAGHAFVEGTIADNRAIDYSGQAQPELVAVNMNIYAFNAGLPLIDKFGHVIGMQTMSVPGVVPASNNNGLGNEDYVQQIGDGMVAGPSQFFMLRIIKILLWSLNGNTQGQVENVKDLAGNYLRYIQGFLGLSWEVFTGKHYMAKRNPTGQLNDNVTLFDGATYLDHDKKEIIGLRVVGIANEALPSQNPNAIFLPGNNGITPAVIAAATNPPPGPPAPTVAANNDKAVIEGNPPSPWAISPLVVVNTVNNVQTSTPLVFVNDVITHANGCKLGGLTDQIPIDLLLARLRPGAEVKLVVRSSVSSIPPTQATSLTTTGYTTVSELRVRLAYPPKFYDYPWYKYTAFPFYELIGLASFAFEPFYDNIYPIQNPGALPNNAALTPTLAVI